MELDQVVWIIARPETALFPWILPAEESQPSSYRGWRSNGKILTLNNMIYFISTLYHKIVHCFSSIIPYHVRDTVHM
jgi:hypothetical protein